MISVLIFVLNVAWQVSVLFLLSQIIARLFRRASARFEYVLWASVLLIASLTPWLNFATSGTAIHAIKWSWHSNVVGGFGLWLNGGASSAQTQAAAPQHWSALPLALASLYLFFIATQFGRLFWGSFVVRRVVRQATACDDQRVLRIGQGFLNGKRGRSVRILVSAAASVPFVEGVAHPAIILPNTLLASATDEELSAMLAHEFAHVERNDWIFNLFALLFSIPISFHPLAGLMRKRAEASREAACDEFAAGCMASPAAYARALLDLAGKLAQPQPSLPAVYKGAALGVLDGSTLGDRIRRLMDRSPRLSIKRTRLTLFACIGVLIVASAAVTNLALAAPSPTDGSSPLAGVWIGQFVDQHPGTGLPKAVRTPVCLQLQQGTVEINGNWGCQNLGPSFPIHDAKLSDDRLHFTASPPSEGGVIVTWTFDLSLTGNQMSGAGHAVRNDGHSWDVEVNLARKP